MPRVLLPAVMVPSALLLLVGFSTSSAWLQGARAQPSYPAVEWVVVGDLSPTTAASLAPTNSSKWQTVDLFPGGAGRAAEFIPELQRWLIGGTGSTMYQKLIGFPGYESFTSPFTTLTAGFAFSEAQCKFVAAGQSSDGTILASSTDGTTWTPNAKRVFSQATSVTFGGGTWLATGRVSRQDCSTTPCPNVMTSSDGDTWTESVVFPQDNDFAGSASDAAYSGSRWVVVGGLVGVSTVRSIYHSTDGTSWTAATGANNLDFGQGVAFSPSQNKWVAVGEASTGPPFYFSADGRAWTAGTFSGGAEPTGTISKVFSVTWNNRLNRFIAGAQGDRSNVWESSDGENWIGRGRTMIGIRCYAVAGRQDGASTACPGLTPITTSFPVYTTGNATSSGGSGSGSGTGSTSGTGTAGSTTSSVEEGSPAAAPVPALACALVAAAALAAASEW